jgi:hypothetical protein
MTNTMTIAIYGNRGTHAIDLPAKWAVCPACEGEGKSSSYLGAFTASEWRDQDDDFKQNYCAGAYDRPCETCNGRSTVQRIDVERLTRWQRRLYAEYCSQLRDFASIDAEQAAERRMGA